MRELFEQLKDELQKLVNDYKKDYLKRAPKEEDILIKLESIAADITIILNNAHMQKYITKSEYESIIDRIETIGETATYIETLTSTSGILGINKQSTQSLKNFPIANLIAKRVMKWRKDMNDHLAKQTNTNQNNTNQNQSANDLENRFKELEIKFGGQIQEAKIEAQKAKEEAHNAGKRAIDLEQKFNDSQVQVSLYSAAANDVQSLLRQLMNQAKDVKIKDDKTRQDINLGQKIQQLFAVHSKVLKYEAPATSDVINSSMNVEKITTSATDSQNVVRPLPDKYSVKGHVPPMPKPTEAIFAEWIKVHGLNYLKSKIVRILSDVKLAAAYELCLAWDNYKKLNQPNSLHNTYDATITAVLEEMIAEVAENYKKSWNEVLTKLNEIVNAKFPENNTRSELLYGLLSQFNEFNYSDTARQTSDLEIFKDLNKLYANQVFFPFNKAKAKFYYTQVEAMQKAGLTNKETVVPTTNTPVM